MDYIIMSDSSCDIENEYIKKHDVIVVPFYVSYDGETYKKEGVELKRKTFCEEISKNKIYPKTSLPSIHDYADYFLQYAQANRPIICITINAKFSGSYHSALNARGIVLESYPDALITVIDSTLLTASQNLLVKEAVRMREDGVPYQTCANRLELLKRTGQVVFTIENMEYLKKGGRIGRLLTLAGSRLGIRPIITMDNGELVPAGITRSRSKAIRKLIDYVEDYFNKQSHPIKDYAICVGAGLHMEDLSELKQLLEEKLSIHEISTCQIGATVCSHTGPEIIGIAFIQRYDA